MSGEIFGVFAILFWIGLGGLAGLTLTICADLASTWAARWLESPREDSAYTQPHGDWPAVPDFHSSHVRSNTDA